MQSGITLCEEARAVQADESRAQIVIPADDSRTQSISQQTFREPGYGLAVCDDLRAGFEAFCTVKPKTITLHLTLPDTIGQEICKAMGSEQPDRPFIVVAQISKAFEKVSPLELGANNCVAKPFSPTQLILRFKRSCLGPQARVTPIPTYTFGEFEIDFARMIARRAGKPVAVTTLEFKLLKYFLNNAERVLSRRELLDEVWGYSFYPTTRSVDNQILKLRQKVEPNPTEPRHLRTVYGAGYKFVP